MPDLFPRARQDGSSILSPKNLLLAPGRAQPPRIFLDILTLSPSRPGLLEVSHHLFAMSWRLQRQPETILLLSRDARQNSAGLPPPLHDSRAGRNPPSGPCQRRLP